MRAALSDVARHRKLYYIHTMLENTPNKTEESAKPAPSPEPPKEIGGSTKPEPTRYGDWEIGGRCVDF